MLAKAGDACGALPAPLRGSRSRTSGASAQALRTPGLAPPNRAPGLGPRSARYRPEAGHPDDQERPELPALSISVRRPQALVQPLVRSRHRIQAEPRFDGAARSQRVPVARVGIRQGGRASEMPRATGTARRREPVDHERRVLPAPRRGGEPGRHIQPRQGLDPRWSDAGGWPQAVDPGPRIS